MSHLPAVTKDFLLAKDGAELEKFKAPMEPFCAFHMFNATRLRAVFQ